MPKKFFCYVDETGQHTEGELFIVSVVVVPGPQREDVLELCEAIEQTTGKGSFKWVRTARKTRHDYMQEMMGRQLIKKDCLTFATYRNRQDYTDMTVQTIAWALWSVAGDDYKATVRIDGLPRHQERAVGLILRRRGVQVKKVRGVKRDENDPLIRLADALCGLVREAEEGRTEMKALFERGLQQGSLRDLAG